MRKIGLVAIMALCSIGVMAQGTKKDTAQVATKKYQPDLKRVYEFKLLGTVQDVQGWFNVIGESSIDLSPRLSGAQIQESKKAARMFIDSVNAQFRRQYVADSLRSIKKGK